MHTHFTVILFNSIEFDNYTTAQDAQWAAMLILLHCPVLNILSWLVMRLRLITYYFNELLIVWMASQLKNRQLKYQLDNVLYNWCIYFHSIVYRFANMGYILALDFPTLTIKDTRVTQNFYVPWQSGKQILDFSFYSTQRNGLIYP